MPVNNRIKVSIEEPDFDYWNAHFPEGLGCCAFSSPAFQKIMVELENKGKEQSYWKQRFLSIHWKHNRLTLPILARPTRFGRWVFVTCPIGYSVTPIEKAYLNSEEMNAFLEAICRLRFAFVNCWLPPWPPAASAILESQMRWQGTLNISTIDSYVITLDGFIKEHIQNNVSRTMQRYIRVNHRNGLTILRNPSEKARRCYFELYRMVYHERKWLGPQFTWEFINNLSNMLGAGGELVLQQYGSKIVGGGVLLYDHDAVHYFQGAIDRKAHEIYPHVGLYTYALKQAESRNLRYANLGGVNTGNTGLIQFKESWGALPTPLKTLQWQSGLKLFFRRLASP